MTRVVVLFSGGLDSILATRILQEQNVDLVALNVSTGFDASRAKASQGAAALGVPLDVRHVGEDYFELIRNPRYGYGKACNPCTDCHLYMCRMAARLREELDACAVATGEVLGQRPMSQRRGQLDLIERRSGLEGRLLRPLSAKLLDPTLPEQEGLIDRRMLHDFSGRGRRQLIELAERLGIDRIPTPSPGCALTDKSFAPRVRDLLQAEPRATGWDFELLVVGRHFRFDALTKIVVGRDADENAELRRRFDLEAGSPTALLHPESFLGADALVVGQVTDEALRFAGALILRYSRQADSSDARVRIVHGENSRIVHMDGDAAAESAVPL